jgi:hypothetical protein
VVCKDGSYPIKDGENRVDDAQLRAYLDKIELLVQKAKEGIAEPDPPAPTKRLVKIDRHLLPDGTVISEKITPIDPPPYRHAPPPPVPREPVPAPKAAIVTGDVATWLDEYSVLHVCRVISFENEQTAVVRYGSGNKEITRRMRTVDLTRLETRS